jgi:two-component system, cell cycle response regulator DivK
MEFHILSKANPMSIIPSNTKSAARPARQYSRRAAQRPTILVVEDHDDTREMLHMMLEMWGCRVVEARNGLEAVETAARERPELILMDGSLPFLDGLAATRRIRENGFPEIKILALDGWGTPSYHADALAAGCDDSIAKPLDFDRLHTYVDPFFATSAQGTRASS